MVQVGGKCIIGVFELSQVIIGFPDNVSGVLGKRGRVVYALVRTKAKVFVP